jgi:sulfur transfer complex TusBCD TusB component (DsrH family)
MAHSTFFISEATGEKGIQSLERFLINYNGIERALVDTDDGEVKIEYNEKEVELYQIAEDIEARGFHIKK